jgi:hypothetical protein
MSVQHVSYHTALSAAIASVVGGVLGNPALAPLWSVLVALMIAVLNQWRQRLEANKPGAKLEEPGQIAACVACPHRTAQPPGVSTTRAKASGAPHLPVLFILAMMSTGCAGMTDVERATLAKFLWGAAQSAVDLGLDAIRNAAGLKIPTVGPGSESSGGASST